jgi:MFS transporter, putative metabolite:H+ symporter
MEFCPTKFRGITLVLMNIYFGIGAAYVCIMAWIIMPTTIVGSHQWRYLVGVAALPGFLIIIARIFVTESPRFHLVTGHMEKANAILGHIATLNGKKMPEGKLVYHQANKKSNFIKNLFGLFSKELWLTTVLLWIIWFCLSYGSWGFSFIIPVVLDQLHQGRSKSYIYSDTLLILFVGAVGFIFLAFMIDKFGRRTLMGGFFLACGFLTLFTGFLKNGIYVMIFASLVGITSTPYFFFFLIFKSLGSYLCVHARGLPYNVENDRGWGLCIFHKIGRNYYSIVWDNLIGLWICLSIYFLWNCFVGCWYLCIVVAN